MYGKDPLNPDNLNEFYAEFMDNLAIPKGLGSHPEEIVLRGGRIRVTITDPKGIDFYKGHILSLAPPGGKAGDWTPYGPNDELPYRNFVAHVGPRSRVAVNLGSFGRMIRNFNESLPGDEFLEAVSCFRASTNPGFIVRVRAGVGILPALEALGYNLRYECGTVRLIPDKDGLSGAAEAGGEPLNPQDEAQQ